jgi:hypothetical protein
MNTQFLPVDFVVPILTETEFFKLRPLTIHDVVKDYDAVMASRDHLWPRFGAEWGWPAADLTLEQDLIDLAWHQKEFQNKTSFAYCVINLEESQVLGCVYIYPPKSKLVQAEVWFWVRQNKLADNLEQDLHHFMLGWLAKSWPFNRVKLNKQIVMLKKC